MHYMTSPCINWFHGIIIVVGYFKCTYMAFLKVHTLIYMNMRLIATNYYSIFVVMSLLLYVHHNNIQVINFGVVANSLTCHAES